MTLYWVNFNAAIINGWWWWWIAPIVVIVMLFLGLFFLTVGLDEIANPAAAAHRHERTRAARRATCASPTTTARRGARGRRASASRLRPGERFGLVGESGSGKSTMALAILRMIKPPGRIEGGEVWLDDLPLSSLSDDAMRRLRLAGIALVPQGAMNSLNPVMRIREQIVDALADHGAGMSQRTVAARVRELLGHVGLPAGVAEMYPHELSGGMKQRVCIAIAISLRPKVIIADEPTSALDVVVQRQVMETLAPRAGGARRGGHPGRPRHGPDGAVRRSARRDVRRPAGRSRADRARSSRSRCTPTRQLLIASLPSLGAQGR